MSALRIRAKLEKTEPVASQLVRLHFHAPELARQCTPGQFVMLGPLSEDHFDPFLNRPFSIHRVVGQKLQLLVAQVGRGTQLLSGMPLGKNIPMLGPLGKGFWLPDTKNCLYLVAGGVGIAPLVFAAAHFANQVERCVLLYGAPTRSSQIEASALGVTVPIQIATDDGSVGFHGVVTKLLQRELSGLPAAQRAECLVLSCGPTAMLQQVAMIGARFGVPVQVSLENRMACGTGACMGCADMVAGVPQRVCVEGPVFEASEVYP